MKNLMPLLLLICTFHICFSQEPDKTISNEDQNRRINWQIELRENIEYLGHRNWILVVDKAFPFQNAQGIIYLNTNEDILPVLKTVLKEVNNAPHIKPIIYTDKELDYLTNNLVPGIEVYKENLHSILNKYKITSILHDSVFVKIDKASQLFKVLVLKTECILPYTSVFLHLDCQYWDTKNEEILRDKMK